MNTAHLHPMLVHFPIALVIAGFVAELAGIWLKSEPWMKKAGFYLLIVGTCSALLAAFSGLFFTKEVTGQAIFIEEKHEIFAWITVLFLVATTSVRIYIEEKQATKYFKLMLILYGSSVISVVSTGILGGTLVYDYMLGK